MASLQGPGRDFLIHLDDLHLSLLRAALSRAEGCGGMTEERFLTLVVENAVRDLLEVIVHPGLSIFHKREHD